LTAQMHRYFGISLVFCRQGQTLLMATSSWITRKRRCIKVAVCCRSNNFSSFRSAEERFADIDSMVKSLIEAHPGLTTKELNKTLHRQFGTKLTKNGIQWGKETHQLADEIMVQLEHNDKLAWLQSFGPSSETECSILLHFMKMEDFKELKPTTKEYNQAQQGSKKSENAHGKTVKTQN
jgi:hypothetical protein